MLIIDLMSDVCSSDLIAKDRLRIIIAQERTNRSAPDYPPLLQRELLEVIRKYVSVDVDAVKVDVVKDGEHDVADISVALGSVERRGGKVCASTCRSMWSP